MAGKSNERQLYWQEIMDRQAKSDLSIRAFCSREQISEPSFYVWRRKLRERNGDETRSMTGSRRGEDTGQDREFIPLTLVDGTGPVEVIHPDGYRICFTGEVALPTLERILDVLDGRQLR